MRFRLEVCRRSPADTSPVFDMHRLGGDDVSWRLNLLMFETFARGDRSLAQARTVGRVNADLSRVARMQELIQVNCDRLLRYENSLGSTGFQILNRVAVLDVLGLFLIDPNG